MSDSNPLPDPYARIAALYDLEHAAYEEDIDFYANFVEAAGDPVLELGCGAGRLLLPIAEAGFRVTGVDRSPSMLARARTLVQSRNLGDRITLHAGSMDEADEAPGGPFGVAIIALNGLMHLSTIDEQRKTLSAVHRALDPRGQLLIDLLNPTPDVIRSLDHTFVHEGTWRDEDGARVDKFAARRVSPATQTIQTELWYDQTAPDGQVRRAATSFAMRYLTRSEIELLLELTGFAEWRIYGSYDLDPYDDHSDRLIVAAEVSPSRRRA